MSEKSKAVLCPYCGHSQRKADRCEECMGLLDEHSRMATQVAMGPWFIRSKEKPFHPGCSYAVLKKQIAAGKVNENTVLRGPTTNQFWQAAKHVPGVAHLVGQCHECHQPVKDPGVLLCPSCGATFPEPTQRNELGLRYGTAAEAAVAQVELQRFRENLLAKNRLRTVTITAPPGSRPMTPQTPSGDLLEEVLGSVKEPVTSGAAAVVPGAGSADAATAALNLAEGGGEEQITIERSAIATRVPKKSHLTLWLLLALNVMALAWLAWYFFLRTP